ncbi:hypothetical protein [Ferrimonas pelagia]|uniref:Uncharacterized protein n=1 Tax=Ferrimonas pelagia TaxID=1177826 RepID=A0ABP9FKQ5_9GAMM
MAENRLLAAYWVPGLALYCASLSEANDEWNGAMVAGRLNLLNMI